MDSKVEEIQRRIAKLQPLLDEISDCDVTISFTAGRDRVSWSRLADASSNNASPVSKADAAFSFLKLPREIQVKITQSLSRKDLIAISSTCHNLRAMLEPDVFRSLRIHGIGDGFYRSIIRFEKRGLHLIRFIRSLCIRMSARSVEIGLDNPLKTNPGLMQYVSRSISTIRRILYYSQGRLESLQLELGPGGFASWLLLTNLQDTENGREGLCLKQLRTLRLGFIADEESRILCAKLFEISPALQSASVQTCSYSGRACLPFLEVDANLHMESIIVGSDASLHKHSDVVSILSSFPRLKNFALIGCLDRCQTSQQTEIEMILAAIKEKGKHLKRLSLPIPDCCRGEDELLPEEESWYRWVRKFLCAMPTLDLVQFPTADYADKTFFAAKRTSGHVLELDDLAEEESFDSGLDVEELPMADAFKSWPCGLGGLTADFSGPRRHDNAQ